MNRLFPWAKPATILLKEILQSRAQGVRNANFILKGSNDILSRLYIRIAMFLLKAPSVLISGSSHLFGVPNKKIRKDIKCLGPSGFGASALLSSGCVNPIIVVNNVNQAMVSDWKTNQKVLEYFKAPQEYRDEFLEESVSISKALVIVSWDIQVHLPPHLSSEWSIGILNNPKDMISHQKAIQKVGHFYSKMLSKSKRRGTKMEEIQKWFFTSKDTDDFMKKISISSI